MSQFQLYPSFSFDESNVGLRPVRSAGKDRIGLVGEFARGPLNPVLADYNVFRTLYGISLHNGSIGVQVANDQGANDFALVRVLGSGVVATGSITISGTASAGGTLTATLNDGTSHPYTITVSSGDTAAQVAQKVIDAIVADSANVAISAANDGSVVGKVNFTADIIGAAGNSFTRALTGTITGLTITGGTAASLSGGVDAPSTATINLVDTSGSPVNMIKIDAISPGTWANTITVAVTAGATSGKFNFVVTFPDPDFPIIETFSDVDLTDIVDEDKIKAFQGSAIVRAQMLDATKTLKVQNVTLTGGTNGPSVTAQDYINAINKLQDVFCTFIIAPGLKPAGFTGTDLVSINSALTAQAENIDSDIGEIAGLRMAILSAPRGTTVADLPTVKATMPNSKHAVMLIGWGTYAKQAKLRRYGVSPDAMYAGHMVSTPIQVSAAARTSSPFIQAIIEVDTPIGVAAQNEITKNKLDAVILDVVTGGFHCLNGRTTSSDPAWYWSCIRRVYNKIRMDIFFGLQFIKSEPSDKRMDNVVQDTINGYLDTLLQLRVLNGYNPAVSNDSNNPPAVRAQGIRYVDFAIEPVYPNDFVMFRISRTLTGSVRLG